MWKSDQSWHAYRFGFVFCFSITGQFQNKYFRLDETKIQPVQVGHMETVMIYNDREFLVQRRKIKSTESSECWHGPTEQFIDGDIDEYVTGGIFS